MLGISLGPKLESTDDFQKGHLYWHRMDDEDNTKFVLCTQSDPAPDNSRIVTVKIVLAPFDVATGIIPLGDEFTPRKASNYYDMGSVVALLDSRRYSILCRNSSINQNYGADPVFMTYGEAYENGVLDLNTAQTSGTNFRWGGVSDETYMGFLAKRQPEQVRVRAHRSGANNPEPVTGRFTPTAIPSKRKAAQMRQRNMMLALTCDTVDAARQQLAQAFQVPKNMAFPPKEKETLTSALVRRKATRKHLAEK